ncbi:MAG: 6-carboxytetrahydropterin synthase QueD [Bryobacteraceae bacterium]
MFEISVEETFSAAHALRGYRGKCENVHGHNYKVQVTLQGERLDGAGLLVDFVEAKQWLRAAVEQLDHRLLNDVPPFDRVNPTAENMARHFYQEIEHALQASGHAGRVRLARVRVWETETAAATYYRP